MLFIAIPVHNEVETIGVLLWRLRSVLAEFPREYEVVVYDDASTDGTQELLDGYSKVLPLTVLRGERQVGYAMALDHLLRHAVTQTRHPRRDAVLLLQGDFTDPPGLIPEFARRFEGGADLVVGERTTLADAPVAVQRLFRFAGWSMRPFVRIDGLQDVTSSLRLVRIAAVRDLLRERGDAPLVEGDSWTANADLLLRLIPFARRVETVPVQSTYGVRLRETRRIAARDAMAALKWAWSARNRRVKVLAADVDPSRRDETRASTGRNDSDERSIRPRTRNAADDPVSRDRIIDADDERGSRRARRTREERGRGVRARDDGEGARPRDQGERALVRDRQRPVAPSPAFVNEPVAREDERDEIANGGDAGAPAHEERKRKRRKRSSKRPQVFDTAAETLSLVDPAAGSAPDLELVDDEVDVAEDDADAVQRPRRKKRRRRKRSRESNGELMLGEESAGTVDAENSAENPYRDERTPRARSVRDDAAGNAERIADHSADVDRGDHEDHSDANRYGAADERDMSNNEGVEEGVEEGIEGEGDDGTRARRRGRRGRRGGRRTRRNRDGSERPSEHGSREADANDPTAGPAPLADGQSGDRRPGDPQAPRSPIDERGSAPDE